MNITKKIRGLVKITAAGCAAVLLAACGGDETTVEPTGSVRVALTDAPSCGFDQVNITVVRVRLHTSQTANENASGWRDLALTPPHRVNLLNLTNGVVEELGQMGLPAAQYTQLRLVLQANTGGGSPANSVVPSGGSEQALDTSNVAPSGIKLIHPFTVPAGGLADVLFDFDACKSIIPRGNGTYGLKPVIAVVPRQVAEIVGNVDPAISGMRVSAQVGGNAMRTTVPDANGAFKLAFLDPAVAANVDVVFAAPGRATAVISSVPVALQSTTQVSTSAVPISLPFALTRNASGAVMPTAAQASVRALQAVGTVPKIEVASVNANAIGGYALALPTAPPQLATYSNMLPLVFLPQLGNAAKFTLEVSADGYVTQSADVDLTMTDATTDFTLTPAP
jgi:hypothetical protein